MKGNLYIYMASIIYLSASEVPHSLNTLIFHARRPSPRLAGLSVHAFRTFPLLPWSHWSMRSYTLDISLGISSSSSSTTAARPSSLPGVKRFVSYYSALLIKIININEQRWPLLHLGFCSCCTLSIFAVMSVSLPLLLVMSSAWGRRYTLISPVQQAQSNTFFFFPQVQQA